MAKDLKGTAPSPSPPPTDLIHATEKGVDGKPVYKITVEAAGTASGSNPNNAIDGMKSTAWKGAGACSLHMKLAGDGNVTAVGLKIAGNDITSISTSRDVNFQAAQYTKQAGEDGMTYYIFPSVIASTVAISGTDLEIITAQVYEENPVIVAPPAPPSPPPSPDQPGAGIMYQGFPIPAPFIPVGALSSGSDWVDWGRTSTHLASNGTIPSRRWDNKKFPKTLNMMGGYELNIGNRLTHDLNSLRGIIPESEIKEAEVHERKFKAKQAEGKAYANNGDEFLADCGYSENVKRGLVQAKASAVDDQDDMKFNADGHDDSNGGWYIPNISFLEGIAQGGKEYPHPSTAHFAFKKYNKKAFGTLKNRWVGVIFYKYINAKGNPVHGLYCNYNCTGKPEDYVLGGESEDTGDLKPGPICKTIGQMGKKEQSIQIRVDSAHDMQIRKMFAVEIKPKD